MEAALHVMMNLVAFGLAAVAILAAIAVGIGNVKALSHPIARIVITPILAVLGIWILLHGIQHMVSG